MGRLLRPGGICGTCNLWHRDKTEAPVHDPYGLCAFHNQRTRSSGQCAAWLPLRDAQRQLTIPESRYGDLRAAWTSARLKRRAAAHRAIEQFYRDGRSEVQIACAFGIEQRHVGNLRPADTGATE